MLGHATAHYCNYAKAPWYESEFTALLAAAGVPNADATHIYVGSSLFMAWNMGAPGRSAFVSVPKQVKVLSHGISAGFTGEVLLLVMMIIYAAANDKVKRSHYETFWCQPPRRRRTAAPALRHRATPGQPRPTSLPHNLGPAPAPAARYAHHFFVAWFTFLLLHGPVWWFWALFTLVPYAIDRLVRVFYRGNRRIALARVYFWGKPGKPDVITLQFDNAVDDKGVKPVEYMEGHYLYLCCPAVETSTWNGFQEYHPFTISSAPDEPVLEVNIRVMPSPFAWTNKVARYLKLLDPNNTGEVELATRNPTTGVTTLGKVIGPDGKPFFRVDAPHGAPSQHCFQYESVLLVGAGIGVTPCASIMKGVVGYRWKKGFIPNNLHFFWVARLSDLTTFKWLLVMLPELKAQELVHNEYYGGDEDARQGLEKRAGDIQKAITNAGKPPDNKLPEGWTEQTQSGQVWYTNKLTGETRWDRPTAPPINPQGAELELQQVQNQIKAVGENSRTLNITLYLTGCKPDALKPEANPKPGSTGELIKALQATKNPRDGKPYLRLKAGRPDWDAEFKEIAATRGREDIGVVFCGAPMIAAQLKSSCERLSNVEKTVFRLHKENF